MSILLSPRQAVLPFSPFLLFLLFLALTLVAGCGGERSDSRSGNAPSAGLKVNTPAQIAQESADNYDDNENGLVTGSTLKRWISDWQNEKPAGISGKLVIIQQVRGPGGFEFIKPDNENVFTYLESGWREPRSNGVIEIAGIVLSGNSVDRLIRKYGIDVKNDLIVCAQGTGGSAAMNLGRCWYTFRYWGVDSRNLAVLDGGNNHLTGDWTAADFTNTPFTQAEPNQPSPIINRQVSSVRDLRVDNTALQATLEDLINVLPTLNQNNKTDGVFLWDGRSRDQFSAGEQGENGQPVANRYSSFQNGGTRQGHPRGSVQLNWTHLINSSTGRFKSKQEYVNYLAGGVDANGFGFVDGTYQLLGEGNAYQPGDVVYLWCETAARAAVTQLVSAVILGLPTRLYDASMIEWNSLTGGAVDRNGDPVLPADSPWRTDTLSAPFFPNQATSIAPRGEDFTSSPPRILNAYAEHTQEVILADRAYKKIDDDDNGGGDNGGGDNGGGDNGGGGVVLPPNPCG